ncbi:MAG: hypothetical protein ACJA1O_000833 [Spirosomataceae bacterium]|jgi:hypothetical protein
MEKKNGTKESEKPLLRQLLELFQDYFQELTKRLRKIKFL